MSPLGLRSCVVSHDSTCYCLKQIPFIYDPITGLIYTYHMLLTASYGYLCLDRITRSKFCFASIFFILSNSRHKQCWLQVFFNKIGLFSVLILTFVWTFIGIVSKFMTSVARDLRFVFCIFFIRCLFFLFILIIVPILAPASRRVKYTTTTSSIRLVSIFMTCEHQSFLSVHNSFPFVLESFFKGL